MSKKRTVAEPIKQYDSFKEAYNNIVSKPPSNSLGRAMAPTYQGTNTGYGDSKYDENFSFGADADRQDIQGSLKEYRAQTQSWGAKAAAGIGRAGVKAAIEVAKLAPTIGGILSAPFAKDGDGSKLLLIMKDIKL